MEDRNASMTMVYKKAAPCHPGRTLDEEVFVVTNGDDNRVIHHQKAHSTKLNVPLVCLWVNASRGHMLTDDLNMF